MEKVTNLAMTPEKPSLDVPPGNGHATDADLVVLAKSGDFSAFEELVTRHERRLYGLALSLVRDPLDAQDVVQTSLLNALEHLADFRGDASFGTWITRIATNTALGLLARKAGHPTVSLEAAIEATEEGDIPHPEFIADWRFDPAKAVERGQLRTILSTAIAELPEKHRMVFHLRDVEGFSVAETATLLGISEANVKVRLLRARLALRERLTRTFGDETKRLFPTHDHGTEPTTRASLVLDGYRREAGRKEV